MSAADEESKRRISGEGASRYGSKDPSDMTEEELAEWRMGTGLKTPTGFRYGDDSTSPDYDWGAHNERAQQLGSTLKSGRSPISAEYVAPSETNLFTALNSGNQPGDVFRRDQQNPVISGVPEGRPTGDPRTIFNEWFMNDQGGVSTRNVNESAFGSGSTAANYPTVGSVGIDRGANIGFGLPDAYQGLSGRASSLGMTGLYPDSQASSGQDVVTGGTVPMGDRVVGASVDVPGIEFWQDQVRPSIDKADRPRPGSGITGGPSKYPEEPFVPVTQPGDYEPASSVFDQFNDQPVVNSPAAPAFNPFKPKPGSGITGGPSKYQNPPAGAINLANIRKNDGAWSGGTVDNDSISRALRR